MTGGSQPTSPEPGAALALSGGGYRAMLFHLGGVIRLNELGWLPNIKQIAGVSGGAILAAWLGLRWDDLAFDANGSAKNLDEVVVEPIVGLTARPLDIATGLFGFLWLGSTLSAALSRGLFKGYKLSDLKERGRSPKISLLATNLLTGGLTELSGNGITEEHLGFQHADVPLGLAVAASCSIPPTFRPVRIKLDPAAWQGGFTPLYRKVRHARMPLKLCDGGNHDNLGLKAVWDRYQTLLVSDGSSPMPPWTWISSDWLTTTLRSNRILIDQIRDMKKSILLAHKLGNPDCPQQGAYWGIESKVNKFELDDAMVIDCETTLKLATMRTRLGRHTEQERGELVNFGYAMADTALRKHLLPAQSPPGEWPVPEFAII